MKLLEYVLMGLGLGWSACFLFEFVRAMYRLKRPPAPPRSVAISELTQGDVRITFDPPIAFYPGEDLSAIVARRIHAPASGDVRHHRR